MFPLPLFLVLLMLVVLDVDPALLRPSVGSIGEVTVISGGKGGTACLSGPAQLLTSCYDLK